MPLFLLYLSNIGDIMARSFKWIYANCCLCRWCPGVAKRRAMRRIRREQRLNEEWESEEEGSEASSRNTGVSTYIKSHPFTKVWENLFFFYVQLHKHTKKSPDPEGRLYCSERLRKIIPRNAKRNRKSRAWSTIHWQRTWTDPQLNQKPGEFRDTAKARLQAQHAIIGANFLTKW